jgi:NAD(P)-dependent dehydrogenase (short-subunit alcohol dehydrogenase family)
MPDSPKFAPFTSDVTHKTVLITGAARRIGRAMARELAGAGWKVAVHYAASADEADEVIAVLRAMGTEAIAVGGELEQPQTPARLITEATQKLGPLGCLINNASIFERDEVSTASLQSWERHIAINLRAPFFLTQAFAAQVADGARGAIINMIDERVWRLTPHFASYTISKAGLWAFTQTAALALAPRIRVNAIGPGPTLPSPRQTQAQFDAHAATMPLGRGTTPEEITAAVRFILAAPAMTGQMIALDGGQHLAWGQVPNRSGPEE